ncbi:hypothetical protein V6Z12_D07G091900 [Gossypium hirsutum]
MTTAYGRRKSPKKIPRNPFSRRYPIWSQNRRKLGQNPKKRRETFRFLLSPTRRKTGGVEVNGVAVAILVQG